MARKDRVYRWVKGFTQYRNLKSQLEKRGWVHHMDYSREPDAFRATSERNGIVIGRRAEHPKGRDTFTVYRKRRTGRR